MWRQRSESSFEINMFSAIAHRTRSATASTGRLVSNWYSRGGFHPSTHSGEPAIMRRRNNLSRTLAIAGAASFLAPAFLLVQHSLFAQEKSEGDTGDAIFSTDTRLVPLNVTVSDKAGKLITNLPQSAFQVFENGVSQQI